MESEELRQEITRLKKEKAALQTQSALLENFVALARTSGPGELLKDMLQKTLDLTADLTDADKGSLFLFDEKGVVTASVLTRSETTPEQAARLIGTVMDKGLAGWVNRRREVGLILDTEADDRWITLPDQPYTARSALAVPILIGERLLGLLTLLHSRPGHFNQDSAELMRIASSQIALALENVRLYSMLEESYCRLELTKQEVETYSQALNRELEKGRQIQRDFLPLNIPQPPGWEIISYFQPTWQVSGDFYDVFTVSEDYYGIIVADVSDKGVGAALFMALVRSLIRAFTSSVASDVSLNAAAQRAQKAEEPLASIKLDRLHPLKAVQLTNDYLMENHAEGGMFATVFFGIINNKTGLLTYINAGHDPLFITGPQGIKNRLDRTGPAVGLMTDINYLARYLTMDPGDILFGYTDGVTDAQAPDGQRFTRASLISSIDRPVFSAFELLQDLKSDLSNHSRNARQSDDITLLAVRRLDGEK